MGQEGGEAKNKGVAGQRSRACLVGASPGMHPSAVERVRVNPTKARQEMEAGKGGSIRGGGVQLPER